MQATIINFNRLKGYGFAKAQSGRNYFIHITDWDQEDTAPAVGQVIEFELRPSKDGRPKAVNIRLAKNAVSAGVDALQGGAR